MIFAFDHEHRIGDICSAALCAHAASRPVLAGDEVFDDVPMLIVRKATRDEYLNQPIQEGWCLPPIEYGCEHMYEVQVD